MRDFIRHYAALLALALLAALLLLSGCLGKRTDAPAASAPPEVAETPAPTPEPTPEPVREIALDGTERADDILALAENPELTYVDGNRSTEYTALAQLCAEKPDCVVDYTVDLAGTPVKSTDESVVLEGDKPPVEELIAQLAYLPRLSTVDVKALKYSDSDCVSIVEAFPEKKIVWVVHFGRWAVPTDAVVFSTLNSHDSDISTYYRDATFEPLFKYCTDLVALDLGHNNITNLEPIGKMTQLQVLILGDNINIRDATPLKNLTNLRYMEFFMAYFVEDFSWVDGMTKMKDLCIGYCGGLDDISFVQNMPELEMGWFPGDGLSKEQREMAQEARPDTHFLFFPSRESSTSDGWRKSDDNLAIRKAFRNWENVVEFNDLDDVVYREGAKLIEVYPMDN